MLTGMDLQLPRPFTCRPLRFEDAQAVTDLTAQTEKHDLGEVFVELEDIVGHWQRPSLDLATDSLGVFDDRLVAYGEVYKGQRAEVCVLPSHRGLGLGSALMRWTWGVALAHGRHYVGQTVSAAQSDARELFRANGYDELYTAWIMEFPEDAEIVASPLPAGTTIRPYVPGREEHAAYEVIDNAFNEWPNRDPSTYEDWAPTVVGRPGFEPWQLLVAVEDDGQVVGACYFSPLDDAGWIDQIAVRGDRRGLGLGRALLVAAFTEARARGATKSVLSTDSRTGALSLYEHVGMRIKQSFVHWAKQLGTESAVASGN